MGIEVLLRAWAHEEEAQKTPHIVRNNMYTQSNGTAGQSENLNVSIL